MSLVESEFSKELSKDPNPYQNQVPPEEDDKIQAHGKHKAAEDSLSQLEVEEEEEEEEGEEEAEGEEGEGEGEEFELCDVCLKDKEHWTDECPYLVCIPNPMEVTLGKGYYMVCVDCNVSGGHSDIVGTQCNVWGGHPDRRWKGRAIVKVCGICAGVRHWSAECPNKHLLQKQKSLLECAAEYRSWLATKKCQAA
ncbi:transcriptional regulator Myc-A [Rosa sericea]